MTETQDEKELILGNKQLISLFFVVVALCGVCFAMGYIIGHNSKPALAVEAAQMQPAAEPPGPSPAPEAASPGDASPAPNPAAAQDSSAAQPSASAPDQNPAAAAAVDSAPVPSAATQTEPVVQESAAPAHTPVSAAMPLAQPVAASGSYLQVGAVSRVDAENLVKTLREQNLPALMAESPRKGLFRVLVGPYRQTADLAEAKSRLKTLGFDNAFVQK